MGKGDSPRNCFSCDYKKNFDKVFRKRRRPESEEDYWEEREAIHREMERERRRVRKMRPRRTRD